MTEADTTIGEDEDDWKSIDDLLDEDLSIEDSETIIDPALLEPQANLAITPCADKGDYLPLPSRLHSSSTTSTNSSPASLRQTGDKGKITVEEACMHTICMMSVSANSLGPEPHNRKAALASPERCQWEEAMQKPDPGVR